MPCDLLVLAPHPDDAEIHCGATIAAHVRQGRSVVVVDCTQGELASRGTPGERALEARAAGAVLGLASRENLALPDGHLNGADDRQRDAIVACLRRLRPAAVLAIHGHARHSDHLALAELARRAGKLASLHAFPDPHPATPLLRLWHYEAELPLERPPALLVPCREEDWERKRAAIRCYASQLARADGSGPPTSIATPEFERWIEARGRAWGFHAGAPYAEALVGAEAPRIADLAGC